MKTKNRLISHLRPGKTYRRSDLAKWSKSLDRHIRELLQEGILKKARTGLYFRPKISEFGAVPPDERELIRAFLKDDRFWLTSFNVYNALGLGTTQLYNHCLVYNHKRHGKFLLGGRTFSFQIKKRFPFRSITVEFLLVDLVNNIGELAEDRDDILSRVAKRVLKMNPSRLRRAASKYGSPSTQRFFEHALAGIPD